jgi:hypothetical protein
MRREFTFLGERTEDGLIVHDRDEVRQWLLDMEGAIYQLGGMFTVSAVREQVSPNAYVTTGVLCAYESFAPAREPEPVEG